MQKNTMQICYISDGKAGHRAQILGLVAGLERQSYQVNLCEIAVQQLSVCQLILCWLGFWPVRRLPEVLTPLAVADLVVGVGHRTHFKVLLTKKILRTINPQLKSLILMQPSLPLGWFDYLIIPKHDHPPVNAGVLVTEGVLNPLVNEQRHCNNNHLILIGGPSKRHGWSESELVSQLQQITEQLADQLDNGGKLIVTTSRRTPPQLLQHTFLKQLQTGYFPQITVYPAEQTPNGWVFEQLQLAARVWVTEDSVSMIYEALTAGCRVHLIQMPRLKQDRITCAVDDLLAQGVVNSLSKKFIDSDRIISLNEADRAARWLIHHLQD